MWLALKLTVILCVLGFLALFILWLMGVIIGAHVAARHAQAKFLRGYRVGGVL